MKTKFTLLPWVASNHRITISYVTSLSAGCALPTELHGKPYHYHAQRIFCAIKLNYVAYQAATAGGRFSSSRCPYLCSPFLDIGAACSLRH